MTPSVYRLILKDQTDIIMKADSVQNGILYNLINQILIFSFFSLNLHFLKEMAWIRLSWSAIPINTTLIFIRLRFIY